MSQSPNLINQSQLLIQQNYRHWFEVLFDWEQSNEYAVWTLQGGLVGHIIEEGSGFLHAMKRQFLGSHRPLQVSVVPAESSEAAISMERSFFWFFSDMTVVDPTGSAHGSVQRRFGILNKKYDLVDREGRVFATIRGPLWRPWTFRIFDTEDRHVATISKKWSGLGIEAFTDADNFLLDFGEQEWTAAQKAVIMAAAITIDFDFFERSN